MKRQCMGSQNQQDRKQSEDKKPNAHTKAIANLSRSHIRQINPFQQGQTSKATQKIMIDKHDVG